jgi:uncharacterized membrane protein
MADVREAVEVAVPVSTAYNQWTQFEEFPKFMENVDSVQQIDDKRLKWVGSIGGKEAGWMTEIVEQKPDERIAWRALDEKGVSGQVDFEPIGPDRTRIEVKLTWEPDGLLETLGAKIGADELGVKRDLENFKKIIEMRGAETGAWRGEVHTSDRVD